MARIIYLSLGFLSLAAGLVGILVPLLPTVPLVILAAFLFGKSSPALERRLIEHRAFGEHIRTWRAKGAISRRGKTAAAVAFAVSAVIGLLLLAWPLNLIPAVAAVAGASWVLSRPTG